MFLPVAVWTGRGGALAALALLRQLLRCALTLVLAAAVMSLQAWDADRTLAAAQKRSADTLAAARALQSVLTAAAALDEPGKLRAVNEFFNRRILFKEDTEVWRQVDYWASPLELLDKGAGDCEDYAIAKYFGLLQLGVPMSRLRLVYVRATMGGPGGPVQAHMVLAYHATINAEPLILDNLITDVLPASRRSDLAPVFSFNGEGLWQGVGTQSAGDPVARLSRWRELLAKARAEGFE